MAVPTFKQECPTCGAMQTIKEPQAGKKVECTKCKDKFVAEMPDDEPKKSTAIASKKDGLGKKSTSVQKKIDTRLTGKAPAPGKKTKVADEDLEEIEEIDEIDEIDELEEIEEIDGDEDEPVQMKSKSKPAAKGKDKSASNAKANGKARRDADDDEDEEDEEEDDSKSKKKPKKAGSSNKLTMGLALAVVVVVLCVAAFFLLRGRTSNTNTPVVNLNPNPDNTGNSGNTTIPGTKGSTEKGGRLIPVEAVAMPLTEVEVAALTNLLPNDTEHVFHVFFKDILNPAIPLSDAAFKTPGALDDSVLRKKIGFSLQGIDDVIHAERYTIPSWSYTVVHFKDVIRENDLKTALKLKALTSSGQTYFQMTEANPWLEQLAKFSFGLPHPLQLYSAPTPNRKMFLHIHNPQTMIIGDDAPILELLKAKGQFPLLSPKSGGLPVTTPAPVTPDKEKKTTTSTTTEPTPTPTPSPSPSPPPVASREPMYLTIKPNLKAILDRMEMRAPGNREKVILSSATDMDANRLDPAKLGPEYKDFVARHPRQFWDVSLMLITETKPRIRTLGTVLLQKDTLKFQYRNELTCAQEIDAQEFQKEMQDRTAFSVATFIFKVSKHPVRLLADKQAPPKDPKDATEEKKTPTDVSASQISLNRDGNTVDFVLDLVLDNPALTQLIGITQMTASTLRVDMDAAASASIRHLLGTAAKTLGKEGLSKRGVGPNSYPPGAFVREKPERLIDREPKNRISWMAGLLPYMGHQSAFDRLHFDQSWRDSGNWLAGRTIVPQFLDPSYPDYTRFVNVGDLPVEFGATHYVGIAGIGLDAASFKRGHPAMLKKQGVFSYDGSASLEEIRQGNGVSNTIVLIQVPHDSITGVSPWIAGGGATLRGVPEKNSIAPFVAQHDKKRGTYVLMGDGTVRFIDQNISDEVFKSLCVVNSGLPENFDINKEAPLLLAPTKDTKKAAGKAGAK